MKTIIINKVKEMIKIGLAAAVFVSPLFLSSCVDNDSDAPINYYSATKLTAAEFLEENQGQFSQFTEMLKRTPYFSLLATYGTYTVFAPNNEGMTNYLQSNGYSSVAEVPTAKCDTIVRTHIIKKGAFFTTDVGEGRMPEMNMIDGYIELTSDSDKMNNNALIYYINKNARMVEYDDSVTNGVVHVINNVITPSNSLLSDKIAEDSTLTLFSEALKATGMADSLRKYIDETYSCGIDSVEDGKMVRCTSGSALYTLAKWPEKRYFKYTAFVEQDSVFHKKGIYTFDDLKAYAKSVYDATYPEDAGLYDDDLTNRKNPLNRFVSYHLLPRIGHYNSWVMSGDILTQCWNSSVCDPEEFFETMCPGTIMRFAGPSSGLFINRKGVGQRATVRGVKVFSPSESGSQDQMALNGVYHYIDDILCYTPEVRDVVLNCRIRIDATALCPDFMNSDARGGYGAPDRLVGFKKGYLTDWKITDETFVGVHNDVIYWWSYQGNAVCVSGIFDAAFKLPPVPAGTYEIRLGYTSGEERGIIQVYLNNEPCGIPIDLRVYGGDPNIGAVPDTDDKEENTANDKAMHNRGYMKAMDSYFPGGGDQSMRQLGPLRRVLTTNYLDPKNTYYLRVRQVLDNPMCYWSFDYIELCPKSVYGSPEGEDTH